MGAPETRDEMRCARWRGREVEGMGATGSRTSGSGVEVVPQVGWGAARLWARQRRDAVCMLGGWGEARERGGWGTQERGGGAKDGGLCSGGRHGMVGRER